MTPKSCLTISMLQQSILGSQSAWKRRKLCFILQLHGQSSRLETRPARLLAAFSPWTLLSTTTTVLGYPRPALPSAGSLGIFGTIVASDWTTKLPSTRHGTHSRGAQRKRYKDMLKHNLEARCIDLKELETLAGDRSSWHTMCKALVK